MKYRRVYKSLSFISSNDEKFIKTFLPNVLINENKLCTFFTQHYKKNKCILWIDRCLLIIIP